jgi:hypothetical protein
MNVRVTGRNHTDEPTDNPQTQRRRQILVAKKYELGQADVHILIGIKVRGLDTPPSYCVPDQKGNATDKQDDVQREDDLRQAIHITERRLR